MAFGTGHHATTLGCLHALDALAAEGLHPARVLDLGCGTAVLAMAAARVWPEAQVIASDIDTQAVDVARANAAANGLAGIRCIEATGLDHPGIAGAAPYDLIFANILKGPLIELAPAIAKAAAPGCAVILSGILNEQADEILAVYARLGFNLVEHRMIVDWSTCTLRQEPGK